MSPEEQRVAIAEFCKLPPSVTWKLPSSFVVDNEDRFLLPDFTNDLNACHEMEKILTSVEALTYGDWLMELLKKDRISCITWHATAAQRCEAFLKTLNLWKE